MKILLDFINVKKWDQDILDDMALDLDAHITRPYVRIYPSMGRELRDDMRRYFPESIKALIPKTPAIDTLIEKRVDNWARGVWMSTPSESQYALTGC